ncbi:MAG: hypothetical protein GXO27_00195 [Chlorobi bacterium]|nr:hypothetical protein [Chlorobiota bacterium]
MRKRSTPLRDLLIILSGGMVIVLVMGLAAATWLVNREDLTYRSRYPQITPEEIKTRTPDAVVIFIDPDCPGAPRFGLLLKKGMDTLEARGIPYYVVADVVYGPRGDRALDEFIRTYGYQNRPLYLMDVKRYPRNSGIWHARRRFKEFARDLCPSDSLSIGPGLHIFLKDGRCAAHKLAYELRPEDLDIYASPGS